MERVVSYELNELEAVDCAESGVLVSVPDGDQQDMHHATTTRAVAALRSGPTPNSSRNTTHTPAHQI